MGIQVTLNPSQSTYVSYGAGGNNYNGNDWLRCGVQSSTSTRYITLIQFNLSDYANAVVNSAKLRLYSFDDGNVWRAQTTILAKRNTGAFTASSVTYNTMPASTDAGQASCTASGYDTWYEWDVRQIVQAWLSGTANYGLTIIQDGLTTSRGKVFTKSGTYAPQLVLDYYWPVRLAASQGGISKQVLNMMIAPAAGPINKKVVGMKIGPAAGPINKTVF